jgi:hypothetical protein
MKHKTSSAGPGLIVALGSPSDDAGKLGVGDSLKAGHQTDALPQGVNMDTVPLNLLSMPDDQDQMQPPDVGDVVNYQVTGKVVAIEGSNAMIQRQSINGQDVPDAEPSETNSGNDNPQNANASANNDEGQSLRGQAAGIGMLS